MHIKAEEVSDSEGEADSVPITVQEMKAEPEVSCLSLNDSGIVMGTLFEPRRYD
jgi:hypothetical protein